MTCASPFKLSIVQIGCWKRPDVRGESETQIAPVCWGQVLTAESWRAGIDARKEQRAVCAENKALEKDAVLFFTRHTQARVVSLCFLSLSDAPRGEHGRTAWGAKKNRECWLSLSLSRAGVAAALSAARAPTAPRMRWTRLFALLGRVSAALKTQGNLNGCRRWTRGARRSVKSRLQRTARRVSFQYLGWFLRVGETGVEAL